MLGDFHPLTFDWQRRVLADRELNPLAMVLACAISSGINGATPDSTFSLSDLARLVAAPRPAVTIAIEQLVSRGHMETSGPRGDDRYRARILLDEKTSAQPTAQIAVFPLARRAAFVRKHAARMAMLSAASADAHLRQQLRVQADTLRRKGVAESEIARETRSLELAIKAQQWWCVLGVESPEDAG